MGTRLFVGFLQLGSSLVDIYLNLMGVEPSNAFLIIELKENLTLVLCGNG